MKSQRDDRQIPAIVSNQFGVENYSTIFSFHFFICHPVGVLSAARG